MKEVFASWKGRWQTKRRFPLPRRQDKQSSSNDEAPENLVKVETEQKKGAESYEQPALQPQPTSPKSSPPRSYPKLLGLPFRFGKHNHHVPNPSPKNEAESPEDPLPRPLSAEESIEFESLEPLAEKKPNDEDYLAPIGFVGKFRSDTTPLFTEVRSELSMIHEDDDGTIDTITTTGEESVQSNLNKCQEDETMNSNYPKTNIRDKSTKWLPLVHKNIEFQRMSKEKNVEVTADRNNALGAALKIALQQSNSLRDEEPAPAKSEAPPTLSTEDADGHQKTETGSSEDTEKTKEASSNFSYDSESIDLGDGLEGFDRLLDQTLSISRDEDEAKTAAAKAPKQSPHKALIKGDRMGLMNSIDKLVSASRSASIGHESIESLVSAMTHSRSTPESDIEKFESIVPRKNKNTERAYLSEAQNGGLNEASYSHSSTWDEIEVSVAEESRISPSPSLSFAASTDQESSVMSSTSTTPHLNISEVVLDDDSETLWIAVKRPHSTDISMLERSLSRTIKDCNKKKKRRSDRRRASWIRRKSGKPSNVDINKNHEHENQLIKYAPRDLVEIKTATAGLVKPQVDASFVSGREANFVALLGIPEDDEKPLSEDLTEARETEATNRAFVNAMGDLSPFRMGISSTDVEEFGKELQCNATKMGNQLREMYDTNISCTSPTSREIASFTQKICDAPSLFTSDQFMSTADLMGSMKSAIKSIVSLNGEKAMDNTRLGASPGSSSVPPVDKPIQEDTSNQLKDVRDKEQVKLKCVNSSSEKSRKISEEDSTENDEIEIVYVNQDELMVSTEWPKQQGTTSNHELQSLLNMPLTETEDNFDGEETDVKTTASQLDRQEDTQEQNPAECFHLKDIDPSETHEELQFQASVDVSYEQVLIEKEIFSEPEDLQRQAPATCCGRNDAHVSTDDPSGELVSPVSGKHEGKNDDASLPICVDAEMRKCCI